MARRTQGQRALPIDLERRPTGRGGWRPKAGRKRGRRVMHRAREAFSARHPLHLTLRVRPEASGLRRRAAFKVVRRCLAESHGEDFRICEFSVMSNHLHLVAEAGGVRALTRGMRRLTTRLALRVNRCLGRRGSVFADRYHLRVLRSPRQVRNGLLYVLQNLRHHGGAAAGVFDPCSSAASFGGWAAPLPRDQPWMVAALARPRATSSPRTWLLGAGWMRHGPIALDEQPRR